ncbi:MAG: hypothetical protein JSS97_04730 [Actinobacteria bacterium]|nr:hypothetical protein [Actinomycetota bacterium]
MPDPRADRSALLAARQGRCAALLHLVDQLVTREEWRQASLEELLPGLGSIAAPFPRDRLSMRSANALGQAGIRTWDTLATETPESLGGVALVGPKSLREVLTVVIREWAADRLDPRGPATEADSEESLRDHLRIIGAWAASTRGASGMVEAIAAAAGARGRLPSRAEEAMSALDDLGAGEPGYQRAGLARAFEELERKPGFDIFRRRHLEGPDRPTLEQLAKELGVSRSSIGQKEAATVRTLAKLMREEDWPIRIAVERLRARLGALARPAELRRAFAALDREGTVLTDAIGHRRALLLRLAPYRVTEEWVMGPEVEELTDVVLSAATARSGADPDTVAHQLAALGIREELQLPWIVGRHGFRLIDGRLVRSGDL